MMRKKYGISHQIITFNVSNIEHMYYFMGVFVLFEAACITHQNITQLSSY